MPGFAIMPRDTVTVIPSAAVTAAGDQPSQDCWLPRGGRALRVILQINAVGGTPGTITAVWVDQRVGSDSGGNPSYKRIGNWGGLALNATNQSPWTAVMGPGYAQGGDSAAPIQVAPPSQFRAGFTTLDGNSITASLRVNVIGE